jgi:acetylornithine deacetylase/succinyl-diaminopimelate desuccinylase-like protein
MTTHKQAALEYIDRHYDQFLQGLIEFCTIPSISTDPQHKPDVDRCAQWVANQMVRIGLENVQLFPTPKHPIVYGELLAAGPDAATILVYGHYDVQPAEPVEKWSSDPFSPELRGDFLQARGATDMKAQVLASLNALEAILQTGQLPVNLKFMIEGEEEIGSPNLDAFIDAHTDLLVCNAFLNTDTGMLSVDQPTITYGLRGIAYFEVRLYGPRTDLHSGVFGGVVHNPAQVLCELVAGMHDPEGKITLPGFYDRVRPLEPEEREELSRLPLDENEFLRLSGAPALWSGETGYSAIERNGARPTLEINGLYSGFIGDGSKTVLPAYAMAKVSMRLVPDQDPKEVRKQLVQYLESNVPNTVRWEINELGSSPASLSDRRSPYVQTLSKSLEEVWGKPTLFKREGGSVPVVSKIQQVLGVEAVNTGFATPGDNMHGPDEKTHLPAWHKGTKALALFYLTLKSP